VSEGNAAARKAIYQARLCDFRPIMMTDDGVVGIATRARKRTGIRGCSVHSGISIVGGLIVSQRLDAVHEAVIYSLYGSNRPRWSHPLGTHHWPKGASPDRLARMKSEFSNSRHRAIDSWMADHETADCFPRCRDHPISLSFPVPEVLRNNRGLRPIPPAGSSRAWLSR